MCSSPPISPSVTASRNSPASASTDSRLSQNRALAATVAVSISFARGVLAPTALTWAPGLSQARCSTGSRALVAATTTSAPRTASSALAAALSSVPARPDSLISAVTWERVGA